jgi:hypothetical protein
MNKIVLTAALSLLALTSLVLNTFPKANAAVTTQSVAEALNQSTTGSHPDKATEARASQQAKGYYSRCYYRYYYDTYGNYIYQYLCY